MSIIIPPDPVLYSYSSYYSNYRLKAPASAGNSFTVVSTPSSGGGTVAQGLYPDDYYENTEGFTNGATFVWTAPETAKYHVSLTLHGYAGSNTGRILIAVGSGHDIEIIDIAVGTAWSTSGDGPSYSATLKLSQGDDWTPFMHAASSKFILFANVSYLKVP